jgi:Spy/CpxP family protein refolding chaperone
MCCYPSRAALAVLMLIAAGAAAGAQAPPTGPYAGLETRAIKALSDQEIADLTAGRGMGTALPAELNGYPGPNHVLEYADQLSLTEQQRAAVKQLFDSMKAEAIPLGHRLIAAERDLDRDFAARTITPERLKAATAAIAQIRGELRNTHLKYHLSTAALLAPDQIHRYAELRGYGGGECRAACAAAPSVESTHPHMMKHD